MASEDSSSSDDLEAEFIRIEAREAHYRREIAQREVHETRQAQIHVIEIQNTHKSDTYDAAHNLTGTDLSSLGAHLDQTSGDEQWPHTLELTSTDEPLQNTTEVVSHPEGSASKRPRSPVLVDHGQLQGPTALPLASTHPYLPAYEYEELQRQRMTRRAVSPSSTVEPSHPQQGEVIHKQNVYFSIRTPSQGSGVLTDKDVDNELGYVSPSSPEPWSAFGRGCGLGGKRPLLLTEDIASVTSLEEGHLLRNISLNKELLTDWKSVRDQLPDTWRWDVEYNSIQAGSGGEQSGCWTCTPLLPDEPKDIPLSIASTPVVIPVEYQWPPISGVVPPPDPQPTAPIDCQAQIPLELMRAIFLTFQGSLGFYILINGLLQIVVSEDFDTAWASSHLPHKYGGLKVCYIESTLEPTMASGLTQTEQAGPSSCSPEPVLLEAHQPPRSTVQHTTQHPSIRLNDLIEARPHSNHRKEKYAGRIGLKISRNSEQFLLMSTHVITEAILARSYRDAMFGRSCEERIQRLESDWNAHTEIWAGNEKIGKIDKTFDKEAGAYPDGFHHDVTLVRPTLPITVNDVASPVDNLGWLNQQSWASLRQQTSALKILANTENHRSGKSIKCSRPSDVLVVGEGIFLNQKAAAGGSKSLKEHKASTWHDLVSRAILYRVYPDFDPPNGYSGTALYADGTREDGTQGPGIVGFQSFVQRSGHVQSFEMEGSALERRLQLGRVAFYGAFEVPAELKEYEIV